jgi:hypothetical protein
MTGCSNDRERQAFERRLGATAGLGPKNQQSYTEGTEAQRAQRVRRNRHRERGTESAEERGAEASRARKIYTGKKGVASGWHAAAMRCTGTVRTKPADRMWRERRVRLPYVSAWEMDTGRFAAVAWLNPVQSRPVRGTHAQSIRCRFGVCCIGRMFRISSA